MPRDGSGVYHTPSGTDAVTNTTISSTAYNTNVHDVETDLNTVRPIVAGGTGSNSADGALAAISGEKQKQVVNDFNVTPIVPGSFFAATSAANSPVAAHAFAGIAYLNDASNLVLEARDITDSAHMVYYRVQTGGTWGAWTVDSSGVRYDAAQTLTAAQQTQARSNIYAAPLDALAYSGIQVNGGFDVSQEVGTTGITLPAVKYFADSWLARGVGTFVATASAPLGSNAFVPGLSWMGVISVSTAQASLGTSDYADILTRIEGYRIARLAWGTANAQPVTIGFWSCHSPAGTYSLSVRSGANDRSYVTTYQQTANAVAEYKTVTIPGCVDGTWPGDSTLAMTVNFTLASNSTVALTSTLNAWQNANVTAATTQVNGVAATTGRLRIGGVVILPGSVAPSAARSPLIMRPFNQELLTCQRYYIYFNNLVLQGYNTIGAAIIESYPFPTSMRAAPTVTYANLGNISNVANISTIIVNPSQLAAQVIVQSTGVGLITFDALLDARL